MAQINPKPENIGAIKQAVTTLLADRRHETILPSVSLSRLYRGRICTDNFNSLRPINIREISYRKDIEDIPLGRANSPQKAMFYASDMEIGGYQELQGLKQGSKVILSHWIPSRELKLVPIGYTHNVHGQHVKLEALNASPEQLEYLNSYPAKQLEFFLTELFTVIPSNQISSDYAYSISAAIADVILSSATNADGIIYPSVRFLSNPQPVDNFAIKATSVDQCLKWAKAEEILIEKIASSTEIRIRRLNSSHRIDGNGDLIWNGGPDRLYQNLPDGSQRTFLLGNSFIMPLENA